MNINGNREVVNILCGKLNGCKDYHNMRLTFGCAIITNYCIMLFAICIWARVDLIMEALGMRQDISQLAHQNMLILLVAAALASFNEALKAYLVSLKY